MEGLLYFLLFTVVGIKSRMELLGLILHQGVQDCVGVVAGDFFKILRVITPPNAPAIIDRKKETANMIRNRDFSSSP